MQTNRTNKILTLVLFLLTLTMTPEPSRAASDEMLMAQDWRTALPAELPDNDQELASLSR